MKRRDHPLLTSSVVPVFAKIDGLLIKKKNSGARAGKAMT
jgi:hypothetical protein